MKNYRVWSNGKCYEVFDSEHDADKVSEFFVTLLGCQWACFGGFFNAFQYP